MSVTVYGGAIDSAEPEASRNLMLTGERYNRRAESCREPIASLGFGVLPLGNAKGNVQVGGDSGAARHCADRMLCVFVEPHAGKRGMDVRVIAARVIGEPHTVPW